MDIKQLITQYYGWLQDNTEVMGGAGSDWFVISTPFIGMFNDTIEIYVKIEKNKIILSDDGHTISNLNDSGSGFSRSKSRKDIFTNILLNFGIKQIGEELRLECSANDFPQKKHSFLEALIAINDMFMLSRNNVSSIFKDDVEEYLNGIGLIYTKDFKFTGVSGIDFTFDFLIAERKKEKIVRAINQLNKTTLTTFLYAWDDIHEIREKVSKKEISAFAIINDEEWPVRPDFIEAIKIKNADYILWSERNFEESINKLKEAA